MINNEFKNYLLFYTDGSKSQDGESTGFSSICPSKQLANSWKINSPVSIFSIETIAILHELDYISKQDFNKVAIFTDSLTVLKSVSSPTPNTIESHLNFLIRNRLAVLSSLDLSGNISIKFSKITAKKEECCGAYYTERYYNFHRKPWFTKFNARRE